VATQGWRSSPCEVSGERGPIVKIEGSGESAIYAAHSRTYRFVDVDGQIKNTALEPKGCALADLEAID